MRATRFDPVSFSLGKKEGGGGTTDYNALSNKPSIGGVTLTGDKTAADLGLAAASELPTQVSDLINDSGFQDAQQVEGKIDAKISSAYKAGGSATIATLPTLTAAKLGVVVNMSEDFTTTADFLEGAGKTYPAGANVVVAEVSANVYKYDVLAGFVDLSGYVEDTRKVGNVPLLADIPVSLTGDSVITVTNTGTASAIGYSVAHNDSGVTAGSKGDTANQTPGFGGTFKALSATVDAKGHVTALGEHSVEVPDDVATAQADGLMSKGDKAKLDALNITASNPLEVTKTGETYNVTLKDSGVTAGSKGDTTNQTPGFGGTFKALSATVDAKGRVTSLAEHSVKIPNTPATQSAAGLMSASDKTKLDTLIDGTLSNPGQAADAKATGDALAALRNYIASMEVYRTASGNPATFADAKAANFRNVAVTITPAQSGSGDPYPPGGGKNLFAVTMPSKTVNGVTFTVNADIGGNVVSVTANGTATADISVSLGRFDGDDGVTYILNGCPSGGSTSTYYLEWWYAGAETGNGVSGSGDSRTKYVDVHIKNGVTASNLVFRPMIRLSSVSDGTFAPYSNIRPVSGVSSVTLRRYGRNLWPFGRSVTFERTFQTPFPEPLPPAGTYTFSAYITSADTDSDKSLAIAATVLSPEAVSARLSRNSRQSFTFTADSPITAVYLYASTGWTLSGDDTATFSDIQLESGSAATDYQPHDAYEIPFVDSNSNPLTVYGGTLDVTSGTLSATWAEIASYNGETLPGRWISDRDAYAAGTSPTTGAQVVYELATPVTYQLTPQQLATLSGYNAVSTDAASVDVTYKADTSISLGGD